MARQRSLHAYGDIVYHRCSQECTPGVVVSVAEQGGFYLYIVDWGPANGLTENHEITLLAKYTPDFKKGVECPD